MGKIVHLIDRERKTRQTIEEQFELSGYDGELVDLVGKLTERNPASQSMQRKEQLHQSLLRRREELSEEELDHAAGGAKPPEPEV
jgi:hypothetical protein